MNNGKNIARTAHMFGVDRKQVRTCLKNEEIIQQQNHSSKASGRGCTAKYPVMEDALYAECKEARAKGKFYPGKELKCSDQWFMRFCQRYGAALRRKTHAAQTDPKQLAPAITKFHSKLLRVRRRGVYQTKDIANMDQTPLPFVLDDGKTYSDKGSSEVWCVSGSSGLDKRQCSMQLTIFADGVPLVRPLVMFRGKSLRITRKEQETWDRRVQVAFQPKAWCDESMIRKWISEQWGNIFINPQQLAQLETF